MALGYIAINVGENDWKADDARWFKANPARSHRLRPIFPGETFGGKRIRSFPPFGHHEAVLVRQVEPGARIRRPYFQNDEVQIPDVEAIIHALFDLVSNHRNGSDEFIGVQSVADLAMKYSRHACERENIRQFVELNNQGGGRNGIH
jgi:hypothetical protein